MSEASEDMKKALAEMKENSKYFIEMVFGIAKNNRTYYEALLEQGFTKEEALELVKAQGMNLRGH